MTKTRWAAAILAAALAIVIVVGLLAPTVAMAAAGDALPDGNIGWGEYEVVGDYTYYLNMSLWVWSGSAWQKCQSITSTASHTCFVDGQTVATTTPYFGWRGLLRFHLYQQ